MTLTTLWFLLIAFLFTGYLVLEGFDFGVGALLRVLGRDRAARDQVVATIGPVWDGNEVWLITAAGAMFAAFPAWYATLLSGFYLPLLAILVTLIVRGVAFEFRHHDPRWDAAIVAGSVVPAFGWGVVFTNLVRGVPLTAEHEYAGGLLDLLSPPALLGGLTFLAVSVLHGAYFLALRTTGPVRERANALARRLGPPVAALAGAYLWWTVGAVPAAAVGAVLLAAVAANRGGREGWAFTGTAVAIPVTMAALFGSLHPAVLPSTLDPAGTLTVTDAASAPYTLKIMTWVALLFAPLVLAYQGWTYWVFRRRVAR